MGMIEKYLRYINEVRRYSSRTQELYNAVLKDFMQYSTGKEEWSDEDFTAAMRVEPVRKADPGRSRPRNARQVQHYEIGRASCRERV